MKKPLPTFNSDEEAERFVDEADLSEYDLSGGRVVHFDLQPPEGHDRVQALLSKSDLQAATEQARADGVPLDAYIGRLVHESLERRAA